MPNVKGKKYPYTKEGMMAAKKAEKEMMKPAKKKAVAKKASAKKAVAKKGK